MISGNMETSRGFLKNEPFLFISHDTTSKNRKVGLPTKDSPTVEILGYLKIEINFLLSMLYDYTIPEAFVLEPAIEKRPSSLKLVSWINIF